MTNPKTVLSIVGFSLAITNFSAQTAKAQLRDPGMTIDPDRTALFVTDPQ